MLSGFLENTVMLEAEYKQTRRELSELRGKARRWCGEGGVKPLEVQARSTIVRSDSLLLRSRQGGGHSWQYLSAKLWPNVNGVVINL